MSRELDIAVARAMGYRVVRDAQNVRGVQVGTAGRKGHDLPYYSEDAALIPVLLEWIKSKELQSNYVFSLAEIIFNEYPDWGYRHIMTMISATPEQHCRAFIACTQAP